MEQKLHKDLEELIHRELSKLSERQAPDTLIPRVLAQIQARAHTRWWRRPWTNWPSSLQLASIPVLIASAAGFVFGASLLWQLLPSVADSNGFSEKLTFLSLVWDVLATLGNACVVLSRAAGPLWLLIGLAIPLSMYLACVGLGTLCYRLAIPKR